MGVLLTMALVGAVASAFIEIRIASKVPALRRFIEARPIGGVIFSLILANFIGFMFGAAGLVVMMMFIFSAVITQTIYLVWAAGKNTSSKVSQTIADFKAAYRPFGKFLKFLFLTATLPLWLPVKIHKFFTEEPSTPVTVRSRP